ncbi:MAG: hypothetical protein JRH01_05515 [Deltaproteobacteria bacterium]|nr:hypothetical protein [Deltaproteobacteria bacterium]MBW2420778.1 hypothetical protein [Deltaproteobacteria bacterium]
MELRPRRFAEPGTRPPRDSTEQILETFHDQGCVILRDVLDTQQVEATRAALQPYLDLEMAGRNNFEGERTQRVYSLVGPGREFEESTEHPPVLEILDRWLQPADGNFNKGSIRVEVCSGIDPSRQHRPRLYSPPTVLRG